MSVKEKFESAEKLRKFSEQLKIEQQQWHDAVEQMTNAMEEFQKELKGIKQKRLEFMANFAQNMEGLMAEITSFKNYDDLLALSKEMLEAIKEK